MQNGQIVKVEKYFPVVVWKKDNAVCDIYERLDFSIK